MTDKLLKLPVCYWSGECTVHLLPLLQSQVPNPNPQWLNKHLANYLENRQAQRTRTIFECQILTTYGGMGPSS